MGRRLKTSPMGILTRRWSARAMGEVVETAAAGGGRRPPGPLPERLRGGVPAPYHGIEIGLCRCTCVPNLSETRPCARPELTTSASVSGRMGFKLPPGIAAVPPG